MKGGECVSVIIPMYNAEEVVIRAIESARAQTYRRLEIIVVDDGSTDDSRAVVKKYISKTGAKNIRLITKKNGGVSSARNAGIKEAKGKFIAFLDADDVWFPEKTELQMRVMNDHPDAGMVGALITTARKIRTIADGNIVSVSIRNQIFSNSFQTSTVMIRRAAVKKAGLFDETQRYAEEGNFWIRIMAHFPAYLLRKPLVEYDGGKPGFGTSGLSANLFEMERGELKNIAYAFRAGLIPQSMLVKGVFFSLAKYVRRMIIVRVRRRR